MVSVQFQVNDTEVYDPRYLYEWCIRNREPVDSFWGIANSFWLPRGMEPTRAFLLMTYQAMQNAGLHQQANAAVSIRVFEEGSTEFIYHHCLFLRATALFAGYFNRASATAQPAAETMYLCEFTDIRGFASSFTHVRQAFNVRTPEGGFFKGTAPKLGKYGRDDNEEADQPKPYSWEEMFKSLWESLPSAFLPNEAPSLPPATTPPIPAKFPPRDTDNAAPQGIPPSYPENYIFQDCSGLHAVARVLHDLNCTLIPPRLSTDKFRVRSLAIEQGSLAAIDAFLKFPTVLRRVIDHDLPLFVGNFLPESITVVFPNRSYGTEDSLCAPDFWRGNSTYRKTIATAEVLPGLTMQPLTSTNRVIYASQCYEVKAGEDQPKNQKYIDAIAKQLAKEYVLSALFAEAPDKITFSGLASAVIDETTYTVPGQRWSALHLYDYGQGLKSALHRYPRQQPPGTQDLFSPLSSSGSRGNGAGLYDSNRPGNAAGSQLSHFPLAEIGAPPSLSRPGSSLTVTPHERRCLVYLDKPLPAKGSITTSVYRYVIDGDAEPPTPDNDDLPYFLDPEEEEPPAPGEPPKIRALKEIDNNATIEVFNPYKTTVPPGMAHAVYDWASTAWMIITTARATLIEEATLDVDLTQESVQTSSPSSGSTPNPNIPPGTITATLKGTFYPDWEGKKVAIVDNYNWPIAKGTLVLLLHVEKKRWMVIKAARKKLPVYSTQLNDEGEEVVSDCFDLIKQQLLIDFKPETVEEGQGIFANLGTTTATAETEFLVWDAETDCVKKVPAKECD